MRRCVCDKTLGPLGQLRLEKVESDAQPRFISDRGLSFIVDKLSASGAPRQRRCARRDLACLRMSRNVDPVSTGDVTEMSDIALSAAPFLNELFLVQDFSSFLRKAQLGIKFFLWDISLFSRIKGTYDNIAICVLYPLDETMIHSFKVSRMGESGATPMGIDLYSQRKGRFLLVSRTHVTEHVARMLPTSL